MIIDGKKIAGKILDEIGEKVSSLNLKPSLKVILLGNNPASVIYTKRKAEAAKRVGIESELITLSENTSEKELLSLIDRFNQDRAVHGILVQLPLPKSIDTQKIISAIHPNKDVDGFHPINLGRLVAGDKSGFIPCTPLGIQKLLAAYEVKLSGKRVVILGRSSIVGKPLALLLMQNDPDANATVTVVHSKSENVANLCQEADILVAAIGQPRFVKKLMVKAGATVIDVGISPEEGGGLVGDVDFKEVAPIASLITPVPGGVGPMTIACLLLNTLKAREQYG